MNDITCENCAYRQSCPVMYSYNNAACLVIRKFDMVRADHFGERNMKNWNAMKDEVEVQE